MFDPLGIGVGVGKGLELTRLKSRERECESELEKEVEMESWSALDSEIKKKKSECYADIDSGLWGGHCKSSSIAKENCALKCLSPACYELIYESDPLEEGEKDYIRSQEFKYCMYK
ncbi:hypothetical protein J1N35_044010 [Gossypium stocksii]|uniref:Uncharacterized protein n=1 Tax=Gossypium stocksii TaxID=47602 RepID=A0A9D3ZFL2_9ROSI|nr:hypothetical protein J1N35_044010 [Gossypium stocksii]